MKKLIFMIVFLASPVFGAGAKYHYDDSHLDDEVRNIYKEINNVMSYKNYRSSVAIQGITVDTITIIYGQTGITLGGANNGQPVQVVTSSTTSGKSTTSSSFVASNLSATITPTSTTNKIVITANCGTLDVSGAGKEAIATIQRGTTNLCSSSLGCTWMFNPGASEFTNPCHMSTFDCPNSTSAQTYGTYLKNNDGSTSVTMGQGETQVLRLEEVKQASCP